VEDKDLINLSREELICRLKNAQLEIERLNSLLNFKSDQANESFVIDNEQNINIFFKYFFGNFKCYAEMKINLKTKKH
jgi:hypothetical protein